MAPTYFRAQKKGLKRLQLEPFSELESREHFLENAIFKVQEGICYLKLIWPIANRWVCPYKAKLFGRIYLKDRNFQKIVGINIEHKSQDKRIFW